MKKNKEQGIYMKIYSRKFVGKTNQKISLLWNKTEIHVVVLQ